MSESVGQIALDLILNQGNFQRQLNGITGLAKKAGAMLAGAFAVKGLVDFGKQCVQLGSDLSEVQNVVDVTFSRMSKQVDDFAKNAATSFGLSETMAKKFTGTFGAMAKAFGFNEKAAYEMSTALTGLSGDVASFYNITQEEAYTKLKSVFTGETESLKDLGIVMTQSALDAYAMANGFGKTTQSMSEMEKVALRYQFVQKQLTLASGDFIRTSDGWANQVRILKLQFDSLKATIGQGLIHVLTPVVKTINLMISKLMVLANAFKSFTDMLSGKKSAGGGASTQAGAAAEAEEAADALNGVAGAAKKAKKATASTGIDELNIINPDSSSGGGAAGGGGIMDDIEVTPPDTAVLDAVDSKFQGLIDRVKELAALFQEGFRIGFGDGQKNIDSIRASIESIKKSLADIFTDDSVVNSINNYVDAVALNLGKMAGSIAYVGTTIGANVLGGLALYLEQNTGFIKERLVNIFDARTEIWNQWGDLCATLADIFSVFASGDGQQITANMIGIFANAALGIKEIFSRDAANWSKSIIQPIVKLKGQIKKSLEDTLVPVKTITSSMKEFVTGTFEKISEVYDTYVDPAFEKIESGFSTVFQSALNAYNEYLLPVFNWISTRFTELVTHLGPFRDSFFELWGKCTDALAAFWDFLSPLVGWFIEVFIASIASKLQWMWTVFESVFHFITDLLKTFMDFTSGVIDFIVGVFTGDWDKAWTGVKEIFNSAWELIKTIVGSAINAVLVIMQSVLISIFNIVSLILNGIKTVFSTIWTAIKNMVETVISAVQAFIQNIMQAVYDWLSSKLTEIKNKWDEIWTAVKRFCEDVWNNIKAFVSSAIESVKKTITQALIVIKNKWDEIWTAVKKFCEDVWNSIKTTISDLIKSIKDKISSVLDDIKDKWDKIWSSIKKFVQEIWESISSKIKETIETIQSGMQEKLELIKEKWDEIWGDMKKSIEDIFNGIWNFLKGIINNIISGIEKMANGVVKGLNKMIAAINNLSFDVPDWVPEIGGGKLGFDIPAIPEISIPKLAQGGFVKANTPQLAMIGDNRHQGEVVAPENKLQEMVDRAVSMVSGTGIQEQYLSIMVDLLKRIIQLIEAMDLTVSIDIREIKKKLLDLDKRSGFAF